jgi:SRSO17 transposase
MERPAGQSGDKVENSRVAVFASLTKGQYSTLIDTRLYLPKEWTQDPQRCLAAGVPQSELAHKSKAELAFEMVVHARQNGVRFSWVGMDGGYGKEPALLRRLEDHGEIFMADVHKDQQIYLEDPDPVVRKEDRPAVSSRRSSKRRGQACEWMSGQKLSLRRLGKKSRFGPERKDMCASRPCMLVSGCGMEASRKHAAGM